MVRLISIKKSTREGKKLMAEFDDGTVTHFGASGYDDFTKSRNEVKRRNYIARHSANETFINPKAASTLARYILWEEPTVEKAISKYRKRFSV